MDDETIARFWDKVERSGPVPVHAPELGPCWVWTAGRTELGYGKFWLNGRDEKAHRVAFFLRHGRIPNPCALHRCDNPPCVNPDHLFEGSVADNNRDTWSKGRAPRDIVRYRKLSDGDVRAIRAASAAGAGNPEIAARFGITRGTVYKIVQGKFWSKVK